MASAAAVVAAAVVAKADVEKELTKEARCGGPPFLCRKAHLAAGPQRARIASASLARNVGK